MKNRTLIVTCIAIVISVAAGFTLYRLGVARGAKTGASMSAEPGPGKQASLHETGKVLYWHDPMVPGQKFDKPGKSPFMDMPLVPVYAGQAGDEGKVSISARTQQNLGMRVAKVTKGTRDIALQAVGAISYNEREVVLVQARSNEFIERLHVRSLYDHVRKGQPLAELYVPEWVAAQEEYLAVARMSGAEAGLLQAARQRMQLAGMPEEQIRRVERAGKVVTRITLSAPISGVVTELGAREGMTAMAGAALFRITGTATMWVNAEVPETLSGLVAPGASAEVTTPALPNQKFKGSVSSLLPEVNTSTRTLKARVEIANPAGLLAPGMFATVTLGARAQPAVLQVPSEAVIQTGARSVVMVSEGEGRFSAVDVEAGSESNGMTEIRKGLTEDQNVVVSGQFLIDSEASLKGTINRINDARPSAEPAAAVHRGEGTVEQIDDKEITLSHGAIPTLKWGAMTMGFKLPPGGLPKDIAVGDKVSFALRDTGDGIYQVATIARLPRSRK